MESKISHPCPACSGEGLTLLSISEEIPYFGEHTQITVTCSACGWRQTDFIPVDGEREGHWSLTLSEDDHLSARVVRGASATIRLPELDLEAVPGIHSPGYVTNVEGVLNRFIDVIGTVRRDFIISSTTDFEASEKLQADIEECDRLENALKALKEEGAKEKVTLEIMDPNGHSLIAHFDSVTRELSAEEKKRLGRVDLDLSN